jgi:DNA-binding CsgD family transcriptional regulator
MSEMAGKAAIAGGAYAATREAGAQLSELVRSMVAMTDGDPAVAPGLMVNGVTEQVVFDVDVDGDRYLLVKILQSARSGASLSPREREIVRMVALGHPNKVIAAVLNISSWTVCTHLRRIFAKLGVTSRAAMVAKAAESGDCFYRHVGLLERDCGGGHLTGTRPSASVALCGDAQTGEACSSETRCEEAR